MSNTDKDMVLGELEQMMGGVNQSEVGEFLKEEEEEPTMELVELNELNLADTSEVYSLDTIKIERDTEMVLGEPFSLDDTPVAISEIITKESVHSTDLELADVSRFVKEIEGFKIFDYKDRRIMASTEKFSDRKELCSIREKVKDNLRKGKTSNIKIVEDFERFSKTYSRFIVSYGDLGSLLKYFGNFNADLRVVKEGNVIVQYILTVGI